jgi:hypothetical protein
MNKSRGLLVTLVGLVGVSGTQAYLLYFVLLPNVLAHYSLDAPAQHDIQKVFNVTTHAWLVWVVMAFTYIGLQLIAQIRLTRNVKSAEGKPT